MAIPLISNVGFTEVDSSGSLNTKAGDRTKLPIQFFRLSDNISGNLSTEKYYHVESINAYFKTNNSVPATPATAQVYVLDDNDSDLVIKSQLNTFTNGERFSLNNTKCLGA